MKAKNRTAGYRLRRILESKFWKGQAACWAIEGLPGVIVCRYPRHGGWQLILARQPDGLPEWLTLQMVPWDLPARELGVHLLRWSGGHRSTRQELLEALRLEQERAEQQPGPSVLIEALA